MRFQKWVVGLSLVAVCGQALAGEGLGILGKWRGELKLDIAAVRADLKRTNPDAVASYDQKLFQFRNKLKMIWNFEIRDGGQAYFVAKASGKPTRRGYLSYSFNNDSIKFYEVRNGVRSFWIDGRFDKQKSALSLNFEKALKGILDPYYLRLMKPRIELRKI